MQGEAESRTFVGIEDGGLVAYVTIGGKKSMVIINRSISHIQINNLGLHCDPEVQSNTINSLFFVQVL